MTADLENESRMAARIAGVLLVACLLAAAGQADVVHLRNGKSFEGVIAQQADSSVRIRLQFGELELPASLVLRVEKGESGLRDYLARSAALRADPRSTARQWLDLAHWALERELEHNFREAVLTAARLDPGLGELAPIMRGLGFVLDEELHLWVPYADYMRRAGFVLADGVWIGREEWEARTRRAREEEARIAREQELAAGGRLSRAVELMALAQVQREVNESRRPTTFVSSAVGFGVPYYGFAAFPGWVVPSDDSEMKPVVRQPPSTKVPDLRRQQSRSARRILRRQPGSVLTVDAH
jgi:hypothetical protein